MESQEIAQLCERLRKRFTQRLCASVSAEGLSEEQLRTAQSYSKAAAGGGVLVGALLGDEPWDLRPLLLEGSELRILRLSSPQRTLEDERIQRLGRLQAELLATQLDSAGRHDSARQQGQVDDQIWVKRRFYSATLADQLASAEPEQRLLSLDLAKKLIEGVVLLEDRTWSHGHICPANIALVDGQIALLDHGFSQSALPPADAQGASAASLTDGQSLAETLLALGIVDLSPALLETLRAAAENPTQGARALYSALFPNSKLPTAVKPQPAGPRRVAVSPLGAGKIITTRGTPPAASPKSEDSAPKQSEVAAAPAAPVTPREAIPVRASRDQVSTPSAHATTLLSAQVVAQIRKDVQTEKRWHALTWLRTTARAQLVLGAMAALLALLVLRQLLVPSAPVEPEEARLPLEQYWSSGQVALMREVAQLAVGIAGQSAAAREVIVGDALGGANRPQVRADFLRFVFNPLWQAELRPADRELALRLALAGLIEAPRAGLPPIQKAHPAVIVAVIGHARLEPGRGAYRDVDLERLTKLPGDVGQAFSLMQRSGVADADARPLRALCHLLLGDTSSPVLAAYFAEGERDEAPSALLERLQILVTFPALFGRYQAQLVAFLKQSKTALAERANWFEAEQLAAWETLPPAALLALIAERLPEQGLSPAQELDLLLFPRLSRSLGTEKVFLPLSFGDALMARIIAGHSKVKGFEALLQFILAGQHTFTRAQAITLITAVQMGGDDGLSMLDLFFQTKPEPESVLRLLLQRKQLAANDPVNGEFANYLARNEWNAGLSELQELSSHRLQLARALAYARLDPLVKEHLRILQSALAQESNAKLRAEVLRKIEAVEDRSG